MVKPVTRAGGLRGDWCWWGFRERLVRGISEERNLDLDCLEEMKDRQSADGGLSCHGGGGVVLEAGEMCGI